MRLRNSRGFTLTETLIAMAIIIIMSSFAVMSYLPMTKQQNITDAYNQTLTALRRAHDQATGDMRTYVVTFAAPNTITVTQITAGGPVVQFNSVLPSNITFHVEPGVPTSPLIAPTTPDGFGAAGFPIDFDQGVPPGGSAVVQFNPDGTATDAAGNINNGVVYLGIPGNLYSSRAVTLWGATGRVRGWRLLLVGGQNTWSQQ